jgi:hypothetical protein
VGAGVGGDVGGSFLAWGHTILPNFIHRIIFSCKSSISTEYGGEEVLLFYKRVTRYYGVFVAGSHHATILIILVAKKHMCLTELRSRVSWLHNAVSYGVRVKSFALTREERIKIVKVLRTT